MNEYIIGFMLADGYCNKSYRKDNLPYYRATLEIADKDILELMDKPIHHRTRIIANKQRDFYSISFNNDELKDIGEYLTKGRHNSYELYKNCKNKIDLIRGYFDGDGTIAVRTKGQPVVAFSINSYSPDLLKIIEDFANEYDITLSKYYDKRGNGSWFYSINRRNDIIKFYNIIYSNKPKLYLRRKYNKFLLCGFLNPVMD